MIKKAIKSKTSGKDVILRRSRRISEQRFFATLRMTVTGTVLFLLIIAFSSKAEAANLYWVGNDGANTSVASNWKTTDPAACGSGDASAAPTTTDVAIFDADCDNGAAIDATFNLEGVDIKSGYIGTITQGTGISITTRTSGWTQADGTFTGGNSNITNGSNTVTSSFTLSGGTFTSTSATLAVYGSWSNTGATFTHNSGTVLIGKTGNMASSTGATKRFYNLTIGISGGGTTTTTLTDHLEVENTLTMTGTTGSLGTTPTLRGDTNDKNVTVKNLTISGGAAKYTSGAATTTITGTYSNSLNNTDWTTDNGTLLLQSNTNQTLPTDTYHSIEFDDNGGAATTYTLGGNTTVEGNLQIDAGATLDVSGSNYSITVGGNWTDTSTGTFTEQAGTVTFNGTGTLNSNEAFNDVIINTSGTITLGADLDVNDDLTLTAGTLDVSGTNYGITVGGDWTDTSTGTFTEQAGTVTFDGTGTLNSNEAFNDVIINTSGTITLGADMDVNDDLTLTTGTLDVSGSNYGITVGGDWSNAGTFTEGSGTVTFDGSGTQTLNSGGTTSAFAFYNIVFSGSGTLQPVTNHIQVNNNLTFNTGAGTFDNATNDKNITVTGNVTMDNTQTDMGDGTWTVSGNWDHGDVTTFNRNSSTIVLNGASKTLAMNSKSVHNLTIDGTISFSQNSGVVGTLLINTGGTLTGTNNMAIINATSDMIVKSGGTYTGTAGLTIQFSASISEQSGTISCATLTIDGDHSGGAANTIAAGTYAATTVRFSNGSGNRTAALLSGDYIFTGTVDLKTTGTGTLTFNNSTNNPNITFQGNVTWTESGGAITWTKGNGTITLSGGSGTNTFDFDGGSIEAVTVNASGVVKQLADNVTVTGLTITAGTFDVNSKSLTRATAGALDNSGTFLLNGDETITSLTNDTDSGTVTYDGGGTYSSGLVLGDSYYHLTFNGLGSWTLDANLDVNGNLTLTQGTLDVSGTNYQINIAGNYSHTSGVLTEQQGKVVFDAAVAQTLTGETFYNLEIANTHASPDDSNDVDSSAAVTVSGTLTVSDGQFQPADGSTFAAVTISTNGVLKPDASANINVSGNWANSGTLTPNSGTVTFNGSGTQTLNSGGTTSAFAFYNIVFSGSGTLQPVTNHIQVNNNLTFNSGAGTFDNATNDKNITVTGNVTMDNTRTDMGDGTWTVSGNVDYADVTTFNANSSTITMDGSSKTFTGQGGDANNITISGSVTTGAGADIGGTLTVSGTFTADHTVAFRTSGGDIKVTSTGTLNGSGTLYMLASTSVSQIDGTISVATFRFLQGHTGGASNTLAAGTYASATFKFEAAGTTSSLELLNGNYTFTGNVTFLGDSAVYTVANSTNNPSITFQGNVIWTESGGGSVAWTKGNGTITLSGGSGTNTFDFDGESIEAVTVDASGVVKQLSDNVTVAGLTITAGTFDVNSKSLTRATAGAFSNSGTLLLNGDETITSFTGDTDSGQVTYDGAVTATIPDIDPYYNVTFNNASGTWTLPSDTDINGTLTLTAGTLDADSSNNRQLNVAGNWTNGGGTFNERQGKVVFDGSGTSEISGNETFYNFDCITAGKALRFEAHASNTTTISGTWTLTGASGNNITLDRTSGSIQWRVDPSGTRSLMFVTVTNSNNVNATAVTPTHATDGGSNTGWTIGAALTVSGTIYTNEAESTNVGADITVGLSVNGGTKATVTTTAGGAFSFSGINVSTNDAILLFVDGDATYEANFISQAADGTSNITGIKMYTSKIVLSHESAGPMTNTLLATADGSADDDIHYTISGSNVDFEDNYEVWVTSGKTYTPGGTVEAYDLEVAGTGTFNPSSNAVTIHRHWTISATGAFTSSGTVTFDASSGTQTVITGGTDTSHDFQNLTKSGGGTLQLSTNAIDIDGTLTISSGTTFDINALNLTAATLDNPGKLKLDGSETVSITTFDNAEGTVEYDGTGTYSSGLVAGDSYYNLTFNGSGGSWTLDANLDVNKNLTLTQGTLDVSGTNYQINLAGTWSNNSGTFNERQGKVVFDGGGSQSSHGETFYDLEIANTASPSDINDVSPVAAVTVSNTLTVTDGQFQPYTGSSFKHVTINANGILKPDASASLTVTGNWTNSGTFTHNSGTVTITATSNLAGGTGSSKQFNDLAISTTSTNFTVTLTDDLDVSGTLTLSGNSVDDGCGGSDEYYVTLSGTTNDKNVTTNNLTINSYATYTSGNATTTVNGTYSRSGSADWTTDDGTLKMVSNTSQNLPADTYHHLELDDNGGGATTYTLSAATTAQGNLTIDAGATLDANSTSNYGLTVGGNWSNAGTFTARSGTVTFNGSGGSNTIDPGSSSFYKLTFNHVLGVWDLTSNGVAVTNALTITLGIFDLNSKNLTATGATFSNAGTLRLAGGETVTGLTMDTDSGTVTYDGSGTYSSGLVLGDSYYHLTFNGSGSWTLDANLDVNGNLTLTQGTLDVSGTNYQINIAGNYSHTSGVLTEQQGKVVFDAAVAQTLTGETFYDLEIANTHATPGDSDDVDSSAAVTVSNTLTVSDGQFQPTTASVFKDVTITANGILKPDGSASISVSGNWSNTGTFTDNTGTVDFNKSSGTQTLAGGGTGDDAKDFYHLTKSGGGTLQLTSSGLEVDGTLTISTSTTVDLNAQNLNAATLSNSGTLLLEGGETASITTPDTDSGTTTYDGSGTYSSGLAAGDSYYHLTFNGSGSWTLDAALDVNGNLAITQGTLDVNSSSNYAVSAAGNWTNAGTFYSRSGTVTFDGTATGTLVTGGTGSGYDFYHVTVNKTSGTDANDNLAVATNNLVIGGTLTVTDGEFLQEGNVDVTIATVSAAAAGKWNITGGTTSDKVVVTIGSGGVTNAGTISFNGLGGSVGGGDSDVIQIRSSTTGTQRTWTSSGSPTFTMTDVDVKDQTTSPTTFKITVLSGTTSGNNTRWLFDQVVDHLVITTSQSTTLSIGSSILVTIAAKDNAGTTIQSGYSGDVSLVFSGASVTSGGQYATASGKNNFDVNFGTATTVNFACGANGCTATSTLKLYAAESISIDVTDGTYSTTGSADYDLDLTVSSSAAATLKFTTEPSSSVIASANFTTQPVVAIVDSYGNTVTGDSTSEITLTAVLSSDGTTVAPGTLSSDTNPVTVTSGVATFSGVKYNQSGTIKLKATSGSLTAILSAEIKVISTTGSVYLTDVNGVEKLGYSIGEAVYIKVTDDDENTDSATKQTVKATITSQGSGDTEEVTLEETGDDTGFFTNKSGTTAPHAPLPSAIRAAGIPGNFILEVPGSGGTIVAQYVDDDDSTDTVTDSASFGGVSFSVIANVTGPVKAGAPFDLLITAMSGAGGTGTPLVSYSGSAAILVGYVFPSSGTKTVSPVSVSAFSGGMATVSVQYPDAGKIKIKVTDSIETTMTGESQELVMIPASFNVSIPAAPLTIGKDFDMVVTARNVSGEPTPNYQGTVNLEAHAEGGGAAGTLLAASGNSFSNGVWNLTNRYGLWGKIYISAADSVYSDATGESQTVDFIPSKLEVKLSPPPAGRGTGGLYTYYSGETFTVTIRALDLNGKLVSNYGGGVQIKTTSSFVMPATYQFDTSDQGEHSFDVLTAGDQAPFTVEAEDSAWPQVAGISTPSAEVVTATVQIESTYGTTGQPVQVQVRLVDSQGRTITQDSTTIVRLTFYVNGKKLSEDSLLPTLTLPQAQSLTFTNGVASFTVSSSEINTITVFAQPGAGSFVQESLPGTVHIGSIGGRNVRILSWNEVRTSEVKPAVSDRKGIVLQ